MMSGDLNRLVNNGHCVALFKNDLGSYTAFVLDMEIAAASDALEDADDHERLTDDFTPEAALQRLADKVMGVGVDASA